MPEALLAIKEQFESELASRIAALPDSRIKEAMGYSLLGGGKRIRPMLLFAALDAYGVDMQFGLSMACAIEMMHTYSLIHDDMPEMDNDELRRGKPCNHIVFGSDIALLAGDALQTLAFESAASTSDAIKAGKLCLLLAKKAGAAGMAYGQDLDLAGGADTSLDQLEAIEMYKTGCLFELPLCAAAILAGHDDDMDEWNAIGKAIGILFQIQDDLLEMTVSEEQMGKSLSDSKNEKATAISLLGYEEGARRVEAYFDEIEAILDRLSLDDKLLRSLIDSMKNRQN